MGSQSGNIQLTMSLDEARMVTGMRRVAQSVDKVEKKVQQLTAAQRRAGQAAGKVATSSKRAYSKGPLEKYVTGLIGAGGVLAALRLVTAELERQREINREAAAAQVTLSAANQNVLRNLGGVSPAEKAQVLAQSKAIARGSGVDERFIANAVAQAISASGGNIPASVAAVRQATKFIPDQPEAIPQFAGAFLDVAKVTGTNDAAVNQGLLQQVGTLSRVVDPKQQAKKIPQSLIGLTSQGFTTQEAGAFFASLSNAAADVEGNVSRTGVINFAKQLNKFIPDAFKPTPALNGRGALLIPGPSPTDLVGVNFGTGGDKIAALQKNPEAAAAFAAGFTARASVRSPLLNLISDPSSVIGKEFAKDQSRIPGNAELSRLAGQTIADRNLDPQNRVAATDRALAAGVNQLRTVSGKQGLLGVGRERIVEVLRASGQSALAAKVQEIGIDALGINPLDRIGRIGAQEIIRRTTETFQKPNSGTQFGGFSSRTIKPTGEDAEVVDIWRSILDQLAHIRISNRNIDVNSKQSAEQGVPTLLARPDEDGPPPPRNTGT